MKSKFTSYLLINPFIKIAGWQAFFLGLFFVLLSGIIGAYANTAFDGVIDGHLVNHITLEESLLFLLVNIVSIVVVLFITGLIISKQTRFIDILGTMTLARAPMLLFAVFGLFATPLSAEEIMSNPMAIFQNSGFVLFMFLGIVILVWFIALMYNGFKVSTGAKGVKLIVGFITGLIVAEIVSKIAINQLF